MCRRCCGVGWGKTGLLHRRDVVVLSPKETPMTLTRRELLASAAALSLSAASGLAEETQQPAAPKTATRSTPIGISTYSFWQFEHEEYRDIEKCIDLAAEWGFEGVEILHRQMTNEENGYLQKLKKRAFVNGLALMGFSTHQGFVSPKEE